MKTAIMTAGVAVSLFALPASVAWAGPVGSTSTVVSEKIAGTAVMPQSEYVGADVPNAAVASVGVGATAGSGCPNESVVIETAPDGMSFTATYGSQYRVATTPISETRKNCMFIIDLRPPAGHRYATVRADHTGSGALSGGVTARQSTTFYYQGSVNQVLTNHSIAGPLVGQWSASDTVRLSELGSVPCGGGATLIANTSLSLPNGPGTDVAGTASSRLGFTLEQC